MQTIRDLKELLKHFEDEKYDDYKVILWDYNNQREADWGGGYSLDNSNKNLTFPITCPPVDGIDIDKRVKNILYGLQKENK